MTMDEYNQLKHYEKDNGTKVNISFTVLQKTQQIKHNYYYKGRYYNSTYLNYKNKDTEKVKAKLTEIFKVKCQEAGIKTVFDCD